MNTESTQVPPAQFLAGFIEKLWSSRAVWAAAKLGLADLMAVGPQSAAALAEATGAHAPSVYRLMRALCGLGVFHEDEQGRFSLTPVSQLMRTDSPQTMRSTLISELGEVHYPAWGGIMHSLRTGQRAFDHVFGADVWTYFQEHKEVGETFHQNMMNLTRALDQAILGAYDFSPFTKVLDVGGGHGGLVSAILRKHPTVRGVVFDVPNVAAGAKEFLASANLADRCDVTSGDFFQAIPVTGADACTMKFILHDWTDEQSLTILRNLHRALPAGATLLLLETVIPQRNEHSFGNFMDLNMLVMTGGRERTADEYRQLLKQAGFEFQRVVPTESLLGIVEAKRV